MKNPFPGMNPYLELFWRDVHTRMMVYIADAMAPLLPEGLVARVEHGISIDVEGHEPRLAYPDVLVNQDRGSPDRSIVATVDPSVATSPLVVLDEPPPRHVEIIDLNTDERVITAIEVLSPTNKLPGRGRDEYREKQHLYRRGGVNLVEIDLIRQGDHTAAVSLALIPATKRKTYLVCVWRAGRASFELYPIGMRDRLPRIAIPLRPSDRDVVLDLQAMIDMSYERGRYSPSLYERPLEVALSPEDARWIQSVAKSCP